MAKCYQIVGVDEKEKLAEVLRKDGQGLLPLVELVEQARMAIDELIDLTGRATVEAVLKLSAQAVAGPKHKGTAAGEVRWHGSQQGCVRLSDRKLRVQKPRLRRKCGKGPREVPVPAYDAINGNARLGRRMLDILLAGVSTRKYSSVLPEMAESVGMTRSSVSREFVEASAAQIRELAERRFDDEELLIIYIDGLRFAGHCVVVAIGVDKRGKKHVLGLAEGATENTVVVKGLLADIVERGVKAGRRRLFVIDGSKALRKAIDEVFGADNPVQRCRTHKIRNVAGYLPDELRKQVRTVMRGAYRLEADKGMAMLKKQAEWLEVEYPSAAASLLEGLEETFTVNRLGLSASLRRGLCTTNVIENPNSVIRRSTGRVSRWRNGEMVMRWAASSLLAAQKRFRRIMGYEHLWMLEAALDGKKLDSKQEAA